MSGILQQARTALSQKLQKFHNRSFLQATMAASALIASADGEINIVKLTMLDQVLATINELKIYDPHDAIEIYREHAEALTADPGAASEKILRLVRKLSGDEHAARLLIKVCVAIGKSDDDFTESKKSLSNSSVSIWGSIPPKLASNLPVTKMVTTVTAHFPTKRTVVDGAVAC